MPSGNKRCYAVITVRAELQENTNEIIGGKYHVYKTNDCLYRRVKPGVE